jgi:fucose permease
LSALAFLAFFLLWTAPLDESSVHHPEKKSMAEDFGDMFRLIAKPLVLVFIVSAFVYVLIEQSIMSWLPTFNNKVLNLPTVLSIQMASILAASTAIGRFAAGVILRKIPWYTVLATCLIAAAALVLVAIPLAKGADTTGVSGWSNAPLAAFVFPVIGLFLAPIYPAINSVTLSALPKPLHPAMAGLSVIFSALGGTTGSIITGHIFESYGGETAFQLSVAPICLLILSLFALNRLLKKEATLN